MIQSNGYIIAHQQEAVEFKLCEPSAPGKASFWLDALAYSVRTGFGFINKNSGQFFLRFFAPSCLQKAAAVTSSLKDRPQ